MALYTESNFSIIKVDPIGDKVVFQLYGKQTIQPPQKTLTDKNLPFAKDAAIPLTHSMARIELDFQ
jgi:hypothetical protein